MKITAYNLLVILSLSTIATASFAAAGASAAEVLRGSYDASSREVTLSIEGCSGHSYTLSKPSIIGFSDPPLIPVELVDSNASPCVASISMTVQVDLASIVDLGNSFLYSDGLVLAISGDNSTSTTLDIPALATTQGDQNETY